MVRRWVCGVVVVAVVFSSLGWSAPAMAKQANPFDEFYWAEGGALIGGVGGLSFGEWWWPVGRVLGAGMGVAAYGVSNHIEGNLFMALLVPGVAMAIFPITALLLDIEIEDPFSACGFTGPPCPAEGNPVLMISRIPYFPLVPAVLAVIGFNMGATMKDTGQPASLPWSLNLPVLSLEF